MLDVEEEIIVKLEENVVKLFFIINMLKEGKLLEDILNIVLDGLEFKIFDICEVGFMCECLKERVKIVLVVIGKKLLV